MANAKVALKEDPEPAFGAARSEDLAWLLVVNIMRTNNRLTPFIGAGLREQKLTAAQYNALLELRAAGSDGLLMSELGERLVVTRSNVTGLVDRLEKQGLAERHGHRDRRATVIRLTRRGGTLLEQAVPEHRRLLSELTECLRAEEKRQLIRLLTKLRRALREVQP
jgi:MarR family 2-MHQ and catechol resistance regulon transcriptional repressor